MSVLSKAKNRKSKPDAQMQFEGFPELEASAFKAGARQSRELNCWKPMLKNADSDMLPEKELTEARALDLKRNNGYIAGAIKTKKKSVVGHQYRIQIKPDWKSLGVSFEVANEFASRAERLFQTWFDSPDCLIDASRKRTGTQILQQCEDDRNTQGECLLVRQWRQNLSGISTCFSVIEPERLRSPTITSNTAPAGIEFNGYGEPVAYHIATKHPNNEITSIDYTPLTFDRITKTNRFGVLQVIHEFDHERAVQSRGFSKFSSVIQKSKMMDRMEDAELEAAIMSANHAMTITSEFGPQSAFSALNEGAGIDKMLAPLLMAKAAYSKGAPVTFDGAKVTHLFPGEKLEMTKSEHPTGAFQSFQEGMSRHQARGFDMSYEAFSGDYSKTSYSSGRLALDGDWKSTLYDRYGYINKVANQIARLFFYEALVKGILPIPKGLNDPLTDWFTFERLFKSDWVGAGKNRIDEFKTAKANQVMLATGETTLADIYAENGQNWEDGIEQRAREIQMMKKLGLEVGTLQETPTDIGMMDNG
jgi:lambda family phage portal protein